MRRCAHFAGLQGTARAARSTLKRLSLEARGCSNPPPCVLGRSLTPGHRASVERCWALAEGGEREPRQLLHWLWLQASATCRLAIRRNGPLPDGSVANIQMPARFSGLIGAARGRLPCLCRRLSTAAAATAPVFTRPCSVPSSSFHRVCFTSTLSPLRSDCFGIFRCIRPLS